MAAIDLFAGQLLEESKRFLEKGIESSESPAVAANLHAALLLAFCAFEAHINSIGEEFSAAANLSVHEKAMILEKDVRMDNGEFRIGETLKMTRLEDRIQFLHAKFAGYPLDTRSDWWSKLKGALQLRNQLTHAKTIPPITANAVRSALEAIIDTLNALYTAIYKKKFPAASQGLQSYLSF